MPQTKDYCDTTFLDIQCSAVSEHDSPGIPLTGSRYLRSMSRYKIASLRDFRDGFLRRDEQGLTMYPYALMPEAARIDMVMITTSQAHQCDPGALRDWVNRLAIHADKATWTTIPNKSMA